MIELRPYDDQTAMAVLSRLDPHDVMEAEAVRGARMTHLQLFAEWRAMQPHALASWCVLTGPARGAQPFAVVQIVHTGQAGVASAALLARDHGRFRRPLAELACLIRTEMPGFCAARQVSRIEARAWADHPRASVLLTAVGFRFEAVLPGFGPCGRETFRQFSYVLPQPPSEVTPCA